jgi:hypothetical protein
MNRKRRTFARQYPPMAAVIVALVLAVFALPSALNLPQANPGQTLEYAPVPGDNGNPAAGGNFAGLGLGSGGGAGSVGSGGDTGVGLPPPPPPAGGQGTAPSTKHCVGNPPRQTEDPLSPPCVAFFQGDNGGSTYQGVDAHEVKVLFYQDGYKCQGTTDCSVNSCAGGHGIGCRPADEYFDYAEPGSSTDWKGDIGLRTYMRYFNDRFQTYKRVVHFYGYYASSFTETPEQRRADAAANYAKYHPFAVVDLTQAGFAPYDQSMAQQGVLVFSPQTNSGRIGWQDAGALSRFPGQVWSAAATRQLAAQIFSTYVCNRIINRPPTFSGNPGDAAQSKRVLGLLVNGDASQPDYSAFGQLVQSDIQSCGGSFKLVLKDPYWCGPCYGTGLQEAQQNMARFRSSGVTTIVWAGAAEDNSSKAAHSSNYYPEVVVAGDGLMDSTNAGIFNAGEFWNHVVTVSPYERADILGARPCYQAYRDVNTADSDNNIYNFGCEEFYEVIRMLFTGIQVAGPRLTPTSMDSGFHAIPSVASTDPHVPACYYNPGDYSCIKDAQAEWWDPKGQDPYYGGSGCYRMMEGGRRYAAGAWPKTEANLSRTPSDPCNAQGQQQTAGSQ